jgi:YD repeat-containing protein
MKLYLSFLFAAIAISPVAALCQYAPAEQGINSGQNYINSPIDSVNTTNGNLVLHIPLISYEQRGTLPDFTLNLRYNGKSWNIGQYDSGVGECVPGSISYGCSRWDFTGYGVQVTRGNTLIPFSNEFPSPYGSGAPTPYYLTGVVDDSGAQHVYYGTQAAAPYNIRTMDGSGVMAVVFGFNGPLGTSLDSNGILHSNVTYWDPSDSGFLETTTDPNGNAIVPVVINSVLDHWLDSVGRQIPAPPGGITGAYDVPVGCTTYQYPSVNSGTEPYTFCYQRYTISSQFDNEDVTEFYGSQVMLSSVTLPDGTSYSFTYDSWGDLTQVTLPQGGTIGYSWTTLWLSDVNAIPLAERVIQSRTLNANDGTPAQQWTYSFQGPFTPPQYCMPATMTDPLGNQTTYSGCSSGEVHYQGPASAGNILSTTANYFQGGEESTVFNFAYNESPPIYLFEPQLLYRTTTTLSDGSTSQVSTNYDTPVTVGDPIVVNNIYSYEPFEGTTSIPMGIPLSTTVTNYGAGVPGPTLKTTTTQYQWQVKSNYLTANFMNLPYSTTVTDGSGTQLSQTTFCYDESGSPGSTCGSPQSTSGHLTSKHSWLNTTGGSISTSTVYNNQGMPTQITDANGNTTAITSYQCSGLFPLSVVTPYQSSTTTAETTTYGYDCNTGQVTSILDPNSQTTNYVYDDPLGRITQMKAAVGTSAESWTTYSYPSSTQVNVAKDESTKGDGLFRSSYNFNGLGQILHSVAPSGATTDTTYDLDGRVASVSSPYLSKSDVTYGITSYLYDALGRMTDQCQPDNGGTNSATCTPTTSYQSWNYSGPTVTFKDENGNRWQRTSDALGRLTNVAEPGGLSTVYTYDALGNLWKVNQIGNGGIDVPRVRTFTYDSLSRLLCAANPESSTASCPTSASTAYTTGTTGYTYDPNSNVISKTDTRGVVTSYSYDALNQILSKSYSSNSNGTPASCYQYDSSTNGIGRLANAWTLSASSGVSCPTASPFLTKRSILTYDPMGRIKNEQQFTRANQTYGYSPAYTYDLAGNLLTSTSGVAPAPTVSPILLTNTYDGAGRLQTVISNLTNNWVNGIALPTTLFAPPPTQNTSCTSQTGQYAPFGGLMNASLGVGSTGTPAFTLNRKYDNRLRTNCENDMGAGTTPATPGSVTVTITGVEQTH